jgi:hypothetical protein
MGRVYRKPKAVEQFLIREFVCDALHYTISRPDWDDKPDSVLTLHKGRVKKRVAIEHTGYHNDITTQRYSPLTPVSDFWKHVQTSLGRRISHRKHLADVMAMVRLNTREFAGPQAKLQTQEESARRLAKEIVGFLEAHPFSGSARFPAHTATSPGTEFSEFPALKRLVCSIRLQRMPKIGYFSRYHWTCLNISAGCIGLNLDYMRTRIKKKTKQAAKYNWRSADEKWLLIVAECGNLSEHAGPPEEEKWDDPELQMLCCESPFHRIYFWERCERWYKSLKPDNPIICPRRAAVG